MMRDVRPRTGFLLLCAVCLPLLGCPPALLLGGPSLAVIPAALDFGRDGVNESFAINNAGGGVLTWTVTESIPWLTVNITSGTTTTELDRVTLTADRTGLLPGTTHSGTITVTSNGGTRTVAVAIGVPGTPVIGVNPRIIALAGNVTEGTFTITNSGNGPLAWTIVLQNPNAPAQTIPFPAFLQVTPSTGTTAAGASREVKVTIDPAGVTPGLASLTLIVQSDAGNIPVEIRIGAAGNPKIAVSPSALNFGTDANELTLNVFNDGAAGSVLTFTVSVDNTELITVAPVGGVSVGTSTTDKNVVPLAVTIDRHKLTGPSGGGTITIKAAGLADVPVAVSVTAAPLKFEGAINRSRPPFLQRFVFLMRDGAGDAIDSTNAGIRDQLHFTVEEDGVVLDPAESNVFISGPEGLKYNIMLLLDFTGSMYRAGIGGGTAIDQMVASAKSFVSDLPASYRVAVMEYHDRQQGNRLIHGFSTDKQPILDALDTFSLLPGSHGASEVFDAALEAVGRLANEDAGALPFDDADVKALVFISDGRDTSSTQTADEVTTEAQNMGVRVFPIGFGQNINAAPLLKMANDTGGHYYSASDASKLIHLLEHQAGTPDGTPGLVTAELSRQLVLTYVTLIQNEGHTYLIRGEYNGLEGSFQRDAVVVFGGDVRAGQLSLRTSGNQGGTAEVFVRAEYIPRGVSQFKFRFITDKPYDLEIAQPGLLEGWTVVESSTPGDVAGGKRVWTVLTTDVDYLRYGSFGNLLKLTFRGLALGESFVLGFRADNRVYLHPPTAKFFQYPEMLTIGEGSSSAAVVPLAATPRFNPDADFAFNRDQDAADDFDDLFPDNPLRVKSLDAGRDAGAPRAPKSVGLATATGLSFQVKE